jgi:hypothetical protein
MATREEINAEKNLYTALLKQVLFLRKQIHIKTICKRGTLNE